jgi:hypothetical protein
MSFTGNEGESISLSTAATMTATYRSQNPYKKKGHFMGSTILNSILAQTGCVGIRVYYGLDGTGSSATQELIFVGVDANGDDLYNGIVADRAIPCPSVCGTNNPLNSTT